MNKNDMVEIVRAGANVTKKVAESVVDTLIGEIIEKGFGEGVTVRGFGTFSAKKCKARDFVTPQGKPAKVAAKTVLKFTASKLIRR